MGTGWSSISEQADKLLKTGQVAEARALIESASAKDFPREGRAKLAHLQIRSGLFTDAMTALHPVIHPKTQLKVPVTGYEQAVYSLALAKIGSTDEALKLLEGLSDSVPEKSLHTAFALQGIWDYAAAIPHLEKYLSRTDVSEYESTVARVNLVACLIGAGRGEDARPHLAESLAITKKENWTLLNRNLQELSGQLLMGLSDYQEAKRELGRASALLDSQGSIFDFFIAKWNAFIDLKIDPASELARAGVRNIRSQAAGLRHYETVRECDRALAVAAHDKELYLKVYYGTPFLAYRRTLLLSASSWFQIPPDFVFGDKLGKIFDLKKATSLDGSLELKPGQTVHRCLMALASDLYKPLFLGHVHAKIFPDEYFNPVSSVGRVANVVNRLRTWISEHELPLVLDVSDRMYRLEIAKGAGLGLRYSEDAVVGQDKEELAMAALLDRLEAALKDERFTSAEAAEVLDVSKSSVVKVLGWGLKTERLSKAGSSRNTSYGFVARAS